MSKFYGWLTQQFSLPDFVRTDDRRVLMRLHTLLLALVTLMVALAPIAIAAQLQRINTGALLTLGSVPLLLVALWMLRRDRLSLAGGLLLFYLNALIVWIAINFNGVSDTSLLALFLVIVFTGLLHGARGATAASIFSVVVLIVVYAADISLERVPPTEVQPVLRLAEMAGLLLVMGAVLRLTIEDLAQALEKAKQEVEERKAAEAALARANQALEQARAQLETRVEERTAELAHVIEASRDGILFVNPDGHLRVVNTCAAEYLQLPGEADAWVGRRAEDLIQEVKPSAPSASAALAEAVAFQDNGAEADDGEIEVPPNILRWYRTPVTLDANELAYLVVLSDVTERRRMETMREDLTRALVHDLRNPLAAIRSSLHIISHPDEAGTQRLSARQRRQAENAKESVREMVRLVDNILDVSRLESGQMPLRLALIPTYDLVTQTVEKQQPLATERGVSLTCSLSPELPSVWVDQELVERVLQNLLDNALKFTPPGGSIAVQARAAAAPGEEQERGDFIEVAVSDSGSGIPPELQEDIFGKFVSGSSKGSGLGLAFCKMAVEAHGGRIWLARNSDRGTRFAFTLPTSGDRILA